jgi:hypothetical protein
VEITVPRLAEDFAEVNGFANSLTATSLNILLARDGKA